MNLQKLFEIQAKLDAHIVQEKSLEGQNLLDEKILALLVEIGELANEVPKEFKFWANKKNNYEKALKEYVDCLHFILSIGLDLKQENWKPYYSKVAVNFGGNEITTQFHELFRGASFLKIADKEKKENHYGFVFADLLGLGEMLGFTWEQIEQAYLDKNKINHERQQNGY